LLARTRIAALGGHLASFHSALVGANVGASKTCWKKLGCISTGY
jgi:hypothetical protein